MNPNQQAELKAIFGKLMDGVEDNLFAKNRDRQDGISFMKPEHCLISLTLVYIWASISYPYIQPVIKLSFKIHPEHIKLSPLSDGVHKDSQCEGDGWPADHSDIVWSSGDLLAALHPTV